MGDFTKAVFDSKTIFEDEVLKKFENCNSRFVEEMDFLETFVILLKGRQTAICG